MRRSDAVHTDVAETWQPFVADFAAIVRDPTTVPAPSAVGPGAEIAAARAALAAEAHAARAPLLPLPTVRRRDGD